MEDKMESKIKKMIKMECQIRNNFGLKTKN